MAHVGDSRIYLLRKMQVQQLTDDHTVRNELLRLGMVAPEDIEKVPRKNSITRAVGVYEHVEVDSLTIDILPGDQFVLASDGLTGYLDDTDSSLLDFAAASDGDQVVRGLIEFANDCGGKDNVTVVLVRVAGEAEDLRAARIAMTRSVLQSTPLFAKLSERERLRVLQAATISQFEAGETVVQQGDMGKEMFVAIDGKLRVTMGDTELRELHPGDHFGEMALLRQRPRTASVTAIEPSEVLVIGRDGFFDLIRSDSHLAVKLLWQFLSVLSQRLERTSHDLRHALEGRTSVLPTEPSQPADPFSTPSREAIETLFYAAMQAEEADSPDSLPVEAHPAVTVPARLAAVKGAPAIAGRKTLVSGPVAAGKRKTLGVGAGQAARHEADDMKKTRKRIPSDELPDDLESLRQEYKERLRKHRNEGNEK
jgi:CRP-like cAMP-binding protein